MSAAVEPTNKTGHEDQSPSVADVFALVERLAALLPSLLPSGRNLDDLMTPDECAEWLGIEVKTLNSMARRKIVPALLLSKNTLRYHPRTVLAKCHENDFAAVKTSVRRGPRRKPFTV